MRLRPPIRVAWAALVFATLFATDWRAAGAQVSERGATTPQADPAPEDAPDLPGNFGLNLSASFPQGDFGRNVGPGFGLTGDLSIRLLRAGWLGLRLDGGMIWYGYDTRRDQVYAAGVPLNVEVTTTNTILQGGIGPQIRAGGYPLNADVYALVGVSRFATRSTASLETWDDDEPEIDLNSTTHLSDWTPSITLGGEVNWTIDGDRQGFLLGIGIGLEYRRHGTTRYLKEGSISEVEGRAVFTPFETRADFWVLRIGLRGGNW